VFHARYRRSSAAREKWQVVSQDAEKEEEHARRAERFMRAASAAQPCAGGNSRGVRAAQRRREVRARQPPLAAGELCASFVLRTACSVAQRRQPALISASAERESQVAEPSAVVTVYCCLRASQSYGMKEDSLPAR